jgi:TRAP transporter TAXI family solute receptor
MSTGSDTPRLGRRTLALGAAALALPGVARAQAANQMSIATGTTGGVYYPLGGALANYLSRGIPGMSATAEVTGGSVANFQLLGAGRAGVVFGQVDAAVDAVRGAGPFRGRTVAARAVAVLYTNRMQVVTTTASGIRTMADMKGKRVSTGAPGSATELFAFRVIAAAGLDANATSARGSACRRRSRPTRSATASSTRISSSPACRPAPSPTWPPTRGRRSSWWTTRPAPAHRGRERPRLLPRQ